VVPWKKRHARVQNESGLFPLGVYAILKGEGRNMYLCPVCGYREMPDPPEDYNICPCCGTEFGYTDAGVTLEELRAKWLSHDAPWFSALIPPPIGWSAEKALRQLFAAGLAFNYVVGDSSGGPDVEIILTKALAVKIAQPSGTSEKTFIAA
jgi:hypothetical protein